MVNQPSFDSYSFAARICLGIAILGAVLLAATTSVYFMQ
jgi:hypothetical protein